MNRISSNKNAKFIKGFLKNKKNRQFLYLSLIVVVLIIISIFYFKSQRTYLGANNSVDLNLAQFSDKKVSAPAQSPSKPPTSSNPANKKTIPNICSLKLSLSTKEKSITENSNIDYIMSLTNEGSDACQNTSISIYYADNETFVSASPEATASNYYWNIGKLSGGEQKTFSITTTGSSSGSSVVSSVDTEACASAENSEDNCAYSSVGIGNAVVLNSNLPATPENPASTAQNKTANTLVENITNKEYGTWVWVSPLHITKTYANTIVEAAAENNINTLYVTFDDYLDIYNLPPGTDKNLKISNYSSAVKDLVEIAKQKGISIDAEAGAKDWGDPENHWKGTAIIDYLSLYNKANPDDMIRGFQYDVESYLLPSYENDKATALLNFISLIDDTVSHLKNSNLRFSVVLPHFYDADVGWTPAISYKGQTNYTFDFILELMDKLPNSSIIIMAYRNFASGTNGSIDLSSTEIKDASNNFHTTKIIVAQETGNVSPSYVTFYNMTKDEYLEQVNVITDAYKNYSGFGGIAVHYIDPFLKLR